MKLKVVLHETTCNANFLRNAIAPFVCRLLATCYTVTTSRATFIHFSTQSTLCENVNKQLTFHKKKIAVSIKIKTSVYTGINALKS